MAARNIALSWAVPAFPVSFSVYQGEDVLLTFTAVVPTSLAGATIVCTFARYFGDPTPIRISGTVTDSGNGVFTVPLPTAITLSTYFQSYIFDAQNTTSGSVTGLSNGFMTMLQQVVTFAVNDGG